MDCIYIAFFLPDWTNGYTSESPTHTHIHTAVATELPSMQGAPIGRNMVFNVLLKDTWTNR